MPSARGRMIVAPVGPAMVQAVPIGWQPPLSTMTEERYACGAVCPFWKTMGRPAGSPSDWVAAQPEKTTKPRTSNSPREARVLRFGFAIWRLMMSPHRGRRLDIGIPGEVDQKAVERPRPAGFWAVLEAPFLP